MTLSFSARFVYFSNAGILTGVSLVFPPIFTGHCQNIHVITHPHPKVLILTSDSNGVFYYSQKTDAG